MRRRWGDRDVLHEVPRPHNPARLMLALPPLVVRRPLRVHPCELLHTRVSSGGAQHYSDGLPRVGYVAHAPPDRPAARSTACSRASTRLSARPPPPLAGSRHAQRVFQRALFMPSGASSCWGACPAAHVSPLPVFERNWSLRRTPQGLHKPGEYKTEKALAFDMYNTAMSCSRWYMWHMVRSRRRDRSSYAVGIRDSSPIHRISTVVPFAHSALSPNHRHCSGTSATTCQRTAASPSRTGTAPRSRATTRSTTSTWRRTRRRTRRGVEAH